MNKPKRLINIRIIYPRYESCFCLFNKVLLDYPDTLGILDVLIESRVNGHMLGPHCESFLMLLLILNADHKGYA